MAGIRYFFNFLIDQKKKSNEDFGIFSTFFFFFFQSQMITVYEITNFLGKMPPLSALEGIADPNRVWEVEATDSHQRWFCCIDGGHRLCALLILWYSGYPLRSSFEFLPCVIIEAEKCLLPVVANALNELTSTVARTCLFDKITTLLELWQSYKKCVKAENKAWALVHEAKCQAKLTEAEKMKDKKMIRKWKAAFKRPKQLKATIFGNNFLLFFMSRRVHHLFYLDSAFSLTSPAPLGAPADWKTKRNDGGWLAKHHLGWDSATKRQNKSTKNYVLATVAINSTKEHLATWKSHFQEVSHFFVIRPSSWYFRHFPPTFC